MGRIRTGLFRIATWFLTVHLATLLAAPAAAALHASSSLAPRSGFQQKKGAAAGYYLPERFRGIRGENEKERYGEMFRWFADKLGVTQDDYEDLKETIANAAYVTFPLPLNTDLCEDALSIFQNQIFSGQSVQGIPPALKRQLIVGVFKVAQFRAERSLRNAFRVFRDRFRADPSSLSGELKQQLIIAVHNVAVRGAEKGFDRALNTYVRLMKLNLSALSDDLTKQLLIAAYNIAINGGDDVLGETIEMIHGEFGLSSAGMGEEMQKQVIIASYNTAMTGNLRSFEKTVDIYRKKFGFEVPDVSDRLKQQVLIAAYNVAMNGADKFLGPAIDRFCTLFRLDPPKLSEDLARLLVKASYKVAMHKRTGAERLVQAVALFTGRYGLNVASLDEDGRKEMMSALYSIAAYEELPVGQAIEDFNRKYGFKTPLAGLQQPAAAPLQGDEDRRREKVARRLEAFFGAHGAEYFPSLIFGNPLDERMRAAVKELQGALRDACPASVLYLTPLDACHFTLANIKDGDRSAVFDATKAAVLSSVARRGAVSAVFNGTLSLTDDGTVVLKADGPGLLAEVGTLRSAVDAEGWKKPKDFFTSIARIRDPAYTGEQVRKIEEVLRRFNEAGPFRDGIPISIDTLKLGRFRPQVEIEPRDVTLVSLAGTQAGQGAQPQAADDALDLDAARQFLRQNRAACERLFRELAGYLAVREEKLPEKPDVIMVLGSADLAPVDEAARLYKAYALQGRTPLVVAAGGIGRLTGDLKRPEARVYRDELVKRGVPGDAIMVEDTSTNTGENVRNSQDLLRAARIEVKQIVLVQTPLLQRRAAATVRKVFGAGVSVHDRAPRLTDPAAMTDDELLNNIRLAVGEVARLESYGPHGKDFIAEVARPGDAAWASAKESALRLQEILQAADVPPAAGLPRPRSIDFERRAFAADQAA